jgi:acetyl esterase/lipase
MLSNTQRAEEADLIEHVVGRRCFRARLTRRVSRTFILPALTFYPVRGPLVRMIPLLDLAFTPLPRSRAVRRTKVVGSDWSGEYIEPKAAPSSGETDGAVLYMHGGAFVFCGLNTHRPVAAGLAVGSGLPVLSVAYRLYPRGVLKDAVDDCLEAFHHLVEQGIDPAGIVLAGDSAGGHLAFAVTLALRDLGYQTAGIVAFSPWLDFDHTTKTAHFNRDRDVMIPASRLRQVARLCIGVTKLDPEHSPVNADLSGLPQVLMICAEDEVLRVDAELMRERLLAHGIPVQLQIWSGTLHAFPAFPLRVPDILAARAVAAEFIRESVEAASVAAVDVVA